MYNHNDTLVSYQDPRAIERRDVYSNKPSFVLTKQRPVESIDARSTFYNTSNSAFKGVRAPQKEFTRTMTASPGAFGKTTYSMGLKKKLTKDSPIVKVTTKRQLYYPALHNETEETLEVQEGVEVMPVYQKTHYLPQHTTEIKPNRHEEFRNSHYRSHSYKNDDYRESKYSHNRHNYNDRVYERDYRHQDHRHQDHKRDDYRDHRNDYRHSPHRDARSKSRTKQNDKYSKTVLVPGDTYTIQNVPIMPTQTLVPMYTYVPNVPPAYSTFYPVATGYYSPDKAYNKTGSGR